MSRTEKVIQLHIMTVIAITNSIQLSINQANSKSLYQLTKQSVNCYFRHEAMTDLIQLMSSLVDNKGRILVPGIYEAVNPVTPEEEDLYAPIDFDRVSQGQSWGR